MKLNSSNPPIYLPQSDQESILRLGFENCGIEDWIYAPDDLAVFHHHKLALLESVGDRCSAKIQGSEPAQREFHDLLLEQLTGNQRLGYRKVGKRLTHEGENLSWDITDRNLWSASTWIPEDICLLQLKDEDYIMTAASVCSPSNWHLEDKIGQSVDFIHAPVPGYEEALSERVNRFLHGLRQGRVMLRYNWSIQAGNELCWQESSAHNANRAPLYWRIERQTFLRLPNSGAVVFGIRIFLHSFASLRGAAGFDQSLEELLARLPAAQRKYKGIDRA